MNVLSVMSGCVVSLLAALFLSVNITGGLGRAQECGNNPIRELLLVAKRTGKPLRHILTIFHHYDAPAFKTLQRDYKRYTACIGLVDTGFFKRKRGQINPITSINGNSGELTRAHNNLESNVLQPYQPNIKSNKDPVQPPLTLSNLYLQQQPKAMRHVSYLNNLKAHRFETDRRTYGIRTLENQLKHLQQLNKYKSAWQHILSALKQSKSKLYWLAPGYVRPQSAFDQGDSRLDTTIKRKPSQRLLLLQRILKNFQARYWRDRAREYDISGKRDDHISKDNTALNHRSVKADVHKNLWSLYPESTTYLHGHKANTFWKSGGLLELQDYSKQREGEFGYR